MSTDAGDETDGSGYDINARRYFDHVADEFDAPSAARAGLTLFSELVGEGVAVLDAGCGPGHVAAFLGRLGLQLTGLDASEAMLGIARRSFPDIDVCRGDLGALPFGDATFEGVVARHSIIHLEPDQMLLVLSELSRVLAPGGVIYVSFFAAPTSSEHAAPFDHAVQTAYQLDPNEVEAALRACGVREEIRFIRQPRDGERPIPHAALIGRRIGAVSPM